MPGETVSLKNAESTRFLEWVRIFSVFFFAVTALFEPGIALVFSAERYVWPLARRTELSQYQAVRERGLDSCPKTYWQNPNTGFPNENLNYTWKENMAATLYKQNFSLKFFVPVQLLPLSLYLSASWNAPENPWQWCHIRKITDLSWSAPILFSAEPAQF